MQQTLETLIRDGFILVYNSETLDLVQTAKALQSAGIHNIEVTCRIARAAERLTTLKTEIPSFRAGAASLLDYPHASALFNKNNPRKQLPSIEEMIEAGADYLVSAVGFRAETYEQWKGKLPIIPGCATPTELLMQYEMGANICKLFPASIAGGHQWIEAVDPAIHKMIPIMPTGGTSLANIRSYAQAGILIFGGSFSMIARETLKTIEAEQDYHLLALEFQKIKEAIDESRAEKYPSLDFKTASLHEIEAATGRSFNLI